MNVLKHQIDRDFTVVSNSIIKNKKLSFKAKGLFVQIISLSEGWRFSVAGLAKLSSEGERSIKSGLVELIKAGYIKWDRVRSSDGLYSVTVTTMYPDSQPQAVLPHGETPHGILPHGKNVYNKELNNKELNNKELNNKENTNSMEPKDSEVSVNYYKLIKNFKVPVRNHNNLRSKIKALEDELGIKDALIYLTKLKSFLEAPDGEYKPIILDGIDIYAKRMQIENWLEKSGAYSAVEGLDVHNLDLNQFI